MSSKIKKDPRISKQQRMVIDIIHTANWLDVRINGVLKEYGITHPQFNILKNVEAASPQPLSIKEIRDTMLFSNSDVSRLVDRLVNKGLVQREICPNNRRKMEISITDKAVKILDEIMNKYEIAFGSFYKNEITVEEALTTSEILRRIRK